MITIRPSGLSMFPDCARRQAARMFPAEITEAGYSLNKLMPSVGASVGTATHSAVSHAMTEKMNSGALPTDDSPEQAGIVSLHERINDEGVQWDPTTPNMGTAEKQVLRQFRSYRAELAERIIPIAVEHRINVTTRRGNTLSGQVDLTAEGGIRDVKTGTVSRSNLAQYGAYSMLRRSEGGKVSYIIEDYIQRVKIEEPQPMPVEIKYDQLLSEQVAARLIDEVELRYEEFKASGDNLVFIANPNSVLCGPKFCPAWGTDWCQEGRQ